MPDPDRLQGSLYDYGGQGRAQRPDIYSSPHESLFRFRPQTQQRRGDNHETRNRNSNDGSSGVRGGTLGGRTASDFAGRTLSLHHTGDRPNKDEAWNSLSSTGAQQQQQQQVRVTFAGKGFDPRRMCRRCTEELRAAIVSSGHDLEVWHTLDHERRALVTAQRQNDVTKARWAERERKERQVRRVTASLQSVGSIDWARVATR